LQPLLTIYKRRTFDEHARIITFYTALLLLAICVVRRLMLWHGAPVVPRLDYFINWRFDMLLYGIVASLWPRHWSFARAWNASFRESRALFLSPILLGLPLTLCMVSEGPLTGHHPFLDGFTRIVTGVCFAFLLRLTGEAAIFPDAGGHVRRAFLWLGDRSYSLYLMHFSALIVGWYLTLDILPLLAANSHRWIVRIGLALAVTFILSDLCYRYVEKPFNRMGAKLAARFGKKSTNFQAG
jgi:peptidoglycan/LPS O-acetylase OafA/YrhL